MSMTTYLVKAPLTFLQSTTTFTPEIDMAYGRLYWRLNAEI